MAFRFAALLVLGATLSACGSEHRVLVAGWELDVPGQPRRPVRLPANLLDWIPRISGPYHLHAKVDLPERWRGQPLSLALPAFDGLVRCSADGVAAGPAGLEAPEQYRKPGPHRFVVPASATSDGAVELVLTVDHRWVHSAWFGAAPRLVPLGADDWLTWLVWIFNLAVPIGALVALFQIGVTSAQVYFTDRRRQPYLWYGLQTLAALMYPLHVLGVTQIAFGIYDVSLLVLLLIASTTGSVYFSHAFFGLPPPGPWVKWGSALATVSGLASFWPMHMTPLLWPALAYMSVATIYQTVLSVKLWRDPQQRSGARYVLVAWLGLLITCGPDFAVWIGIGDPLHGVRVATVGFGLFGLCQSLLFSRRHISSLTDSDLKGAELSARVSELEHRRVEIEALNVELRRQLSEKSAQIYAALALAKGENDRPAPMAPGDVVEDRYRLERRLGAGGMGEVFEVTRLADGRRLALKVAHDPSGAALARLAREAQLALKIEHENVVRVIDVSVSTTGVVYIVMELIEGAALKEYTAGRATNDQPGWVVDVLGQIASGLAALHAVGVVHRDLKPANVLLTETEAHTLRVKITDFGISLTSEASTPGVAVTPQNGKGAAGATSPGRPPTPGGIDDASGGIDDASGGTGSAAVDDPGHTRPLVALSASPPDASAPDASAPAASPRAVPAAVVAAAAAPTVAHDDLESQTGATVPSAGNMAPVFFVEPGATAAPPTVREGLPRRSTLAATSRSPVTRTGVLPGTPAYMAPELARGREHVSPAADLFAFGVMAHELVTGRRPFVEPPVLAVLSGRPVRRAGAAVVSAQAVPLSVIDLIDECLRLEPQERPSAALVAERLRKVRSDRV
jgi:serine/threonine protein kinase